MLCNWRQSICWKSRDNARVIVALSVEHVADKCRNEEVHHAVIEKPKDYGMVSIVMPAHNSASFIKASIESVQAQTYCEWELLVVDDCSTDDTAAIAKSMAAQDQRIRVFVNEQNSGAAFSRNRALREAKGDWIAFLDSDDLWAKSKLEKQLEFMKSAGIGFSYTKYHTISEDGNLLGEVFSGPSKIGCFGMRLYCWPGCLTVMYSSKKIGLIQIGNLAKHNDYAMWLQVSKKAECRLLSEDLAGYRIRTSSISHGIGIKSQLTHLYILWHKGEGLGRLASVLMTCINGFFGLVKKVAYQS